MRKFQFSLRTLVVGVLTVSGLLLLSAWHFDWGHDPFERVPRLEKLPEGVVIEQLGSPVTRDEWVSNPYPDPRSVIDPPGAHNPFVNAVAASEQNRKVCELVWPYHSYSVNVIFEEREGTWVSVMAFRLQRGAENPFHPSEEHMGKLMECCSGGFRIIRTEPTRK